MKEYQFSDIYFLYALALVPLLAWLFSLVLKRNEAAMRRIGDIKLVRNLFNNSPRKQLLKFGLVLVAFSFILVALANLRKPGEMAEVKRKGVDVMILMDVSNSMMAADIQPNRLTKARQFLDALVTALPDDRIGLVLFAGRAYMQMPVSSDHDAARMFIAQASPDAVPTQGTVISEALKMSERAFNANDRKYKSVVLITDGEDHDPEAMNIAEQFASNGIMINTVGIGSPNGSTIPDPATGELKKDLQGNVVVSRLNEDILRQLSAATNGVYTHLDNTSASVDAIKEQLNRIEGTVVQDNEFRTFKSFYQWFIGIALAALIIEFFLSARKRRVAI